ncbi:transmembrane protein, putative [Medicago truncatula]|uniref:Transmembrane protein, putative n=1 Tax=Medicago truncatula TaxID=3880 RepID=G7LC74_MEDTR|nr:transmembrane protein, putative [Medicago truncatula]
MAADQKHGRWWVKTLLKLADKLNDLSLHIAVVVVSFSVLVLFSYFYLYSI